MSYEKNRDKRVIAKGGWSWEENELYYVFVPLIGPLGLAVYKALCMLVPTAGVGRGWKPSLRNIARFSGVGKSSVAIHLDRLKKLGMVVEVRADLYAEDAEYELPSLRDLAKLGEKELKARFGVHVVDTKNYDQQAKTDREREQRGLKYREKRSKSITEGTSALFSGAEVADFGVHQMDTKTGDSPSADEMDTGVHGVDTGVHVADALYKKENLSKENTPLPPAERGEEGESRSKRTGLSNQGEPAGVTGLELAAGDPGFGSALPRAAAWVLAELQIDKRRLDAVIARQMELWCRQHRDATLRDAATRMVEQGRKLHEDRLLLRHAPWGWTKFFSEGHWARQLPYDQPSRAEQQRRLEATVGAPLNDSELEQSAKSLTAEIQRFLNLNAIEVSKLPSTLPERDEVAGRLQNLAAAMPEHMDDLAQELDELESSLARGLERLTSGHQMRAWRGEVKRSLNGKLRPEREEQVTAQFLHKQVLKLHGAPRLGLFYMDQKP